MLSLIILLANATAPSAVATSVIEYLDRNPDLGVTVVPQPRRDNTISHALRLGTLVCDVTADGARCRELIASDTETLAWGGTLEGDWAQAQVQPPPEATNLIAALQALPARETVLVKAIFVGGRQHAYELRENSDLRLVVLDGTAHRLSESLALGTGRIDSFPALDASSLFSKGSRAWGVVLVEGDEGNGNNASGAYNYLLAIFLLNTEGRLELAATHPLGHTAFSRFVGEDGFHMSNVHTLLCPAVSAGVLKLTRSCRGSGEPRDFGAPFSKLCQQASAGRCSPGGSKQDARILAGAGQFIRRESVFVPAAAKVIRPLSVLRAADEEDVHGKKLELIVSERPWVADAESRIEWLEVENRTASWVDLKDLELKPLFGQEYVGEVRDTCVVAPKGVVVVRAGKGPSWNAGTPECFLGEKAVISGALRLFGPQGELSISWSSGGPVVGYSMHCTPQKGCQLGRESPGVRDTPAP